MHLKGYARSAAAATPGRDLAGWQRKRARTSRISRSNVTLARSGDPTARAFADSRWLLLGDLGLGFTAWSLVAGDWRGCGHRHCRYRSGRVHPGVIYGP